MIYLFLTIFFVLMQAFFSGIETGLISISKLRLAAGIKKKQKDALILNRFIRNPSFLLATCLTGVNIAVVCASIMAKKTALFFGLKSNYTGYVLVTFSMTVILFTAEVIPKNWFRQAPYERCMSFAKLLYLFHIILYIPIKLLLYITDFITKFFPISLLESQNSQSPALLREDLRLLLRESEENKILDTETVDILDRAIDFYSFSVDTVKTPKKNVYDIPDTLSLREAIMFAYEHACSRLPVYRAEDKDNLKRKWYGVFSIYDMIFSVDEKLWDKKRVSEYIRPLNIVENNKPLHLILTNVTRTESPLFIVVDSFGNQIGIITPHDAAKALFGVI